MTKQVLIIAPLIAAGALLAYWYVARASYYPVVRIASPDGLIFTAVQEPTRQREGCSAANKRFLGPIRKQCKECQVERALCERRLDGVELAVYEGRALEQHQVLTSGLRLGIAGPASLAKANCELMASELTKLRPATCVYPQPGK